jgi:putative polyhydroxyalkanoate system protein
MPKLTMQTAHSLGRDEAARRLKAKFDAVRNRYASRVNDLQESWTDHTFSFAFKAMGMGITGAVKVEDESVQINAQLPLAATFFKSAIERQIQQELSGLLAQ